MTCPSGKLSLTYEHARTARDRVARREQNRAVSVYRCQQCGGWHVGTHLTKHAKRKPHYHYTE